MSLPACPQLVWIERSNGSLAPLEHLAFLEQDLAQDTAGWKIGEWIRFAQVALEGGNQFRASHTVHANQQFSRAFGTDQFVQPSLESCIRYFVQTERWFTHFSHPTTQAGGVFGIEPEVQGHGAFDLPFWGMRQMGSQNLIELCF